MSAALFAALLLLLPGSLAAAAPRLLSLDQCSDQYALALSPRTAIVGLSPKADDADSLLRTHAHGLPLLRVNLETALAVRPQLVVRTYGGDLRLVAELERRGVRVLTLEDAVDFAGVRRNIREVAAAVGDPAAGEALIGEMDGRLARSAGAWRGKRALYLTPSGFSAGPGTLADAILRAAGLTNAEVRPGYDEIPLERFVLDPPQLVVLAFFDTQLYANEAWTPARHAVVQKILRTRTAASLPGALVDCADWGAAEAVERLAARAPK